MKDEPNFTPNPHRSTGWDEAVVTEAICRVYQRGQSLQETARGIVNYLHDYIDELHRKANHERPATTHHKVSAE